MTTSRFAGKHVLITGAGSGIGLATAIDVAKRGAVVSVVDIDPRRAAETAYAIATTGGRAQAFVADVSRAEDVDALAPRVRAAMGPVDVLVNNAGVGVVAPFSTTNATDWEWVFGVNVWGPIRVTRAFLPEMIAKRSGHVVFVASLAGLVGAPGMVAYSTTKFAAVGFAETLRLEIAPQGVDVTVVCPGRVRTRFHEATRYDNEPFRRMLDETPARWGMKPGDVARALGDAVEQRQKLVVLGPEKIGWWLRRLAPSAAHAATSFVARRIGIVGEPKHHPAPNRGGGEAVGRREGDRRACTP